MYGLQCLIYNLLKNKQVVLRSLIKAAMGASRVLCHWEGTLRIDWMLILTGVSKCDLVGFIWVDPNSPLSTLQHSSSQSFLESQKCHNLYSFNYINDKDLKGSQILILSKRLKSLRKSVYKKFIFSHYFYHWLKIIKFIFSFFHM